MVARSKKLFHPFEEYIVCKDGKNQDEKHYGENEWLHIKI